MGCQRPVLQLFFVATTSDVWHNSDIPGLTIRNMTHSSNSLAMKCRLSAVAAALTLVVALPAVAWEGNSTTPAASASSTQAVTQSEISGLMAYVLKARLMAPEQLISELREQRQLHEAGNDVATLKLALVMADQPSVQEQDITALLQPLFEESRATHPELRAFALLIARDMQDRKRMKETIASTQNRLRDAQRSQEASEAKAAQMRRQIDELQNKINAFMMMEQSILKRGR
jgi:hypothetical protein